MKKNIKASELPQIIGQELKPSSWLEITQDRVNQFADATNDHQFIHIDPQKASQTPFRGTIAHGFLTLSLISYLTQEHSVKPQGLVMALNYGSNKVRFVQAVRMGNRIRARQTILDVTEKRHRQWLLKIAVTIEIENEEKPALIAETLTMLIVK